MKNIALATIASAMVLTASNAIAADALPIVANEIVYTDTATDWTGFYAGVFGGLTTGDFEYDLGPSGGPTMLDADIRGGGALAGVQVGADYQFDSFVLGAVADFALTNHAADLSVTFPPNTIEANSTLDYLGTLRARAGFAAGDLLAYVHGGVAFGSSSSSVEFNGVSVADTDDANRWGYVVGAGVEYAVTENISFQTEYAFTDLGEETIYDDGFTFVDESISFHAIKAGINFRF